MKYNQPWKFTCKTCGDHNLIVTYIWTILAGPVSERWQEWGPLEADHHWHYEFKERVEEKPDKEVETGDFGEFLEDDLPRNQKSMKYSSRRTTRKATSFM